MAADKSSQPGGVLGRPLVFGEILFDELDDRERRPGGAPLNVAWHLRGFGLDPLLISRVGADALGGLVLDRLRVAGLDMRGVQIDKAHPTARLTVISSDEEPHFSIPADQASDHIDVEALPDLGAERWALLYHGSLSVRQPESAATLRKLRALGVPTFIDVNLRAPWWDHDEIESLLRGARWVKVNATELVELVHGPARTLLQRAETLRMRFDLDCVIVTRGEQGSFAVTRDGSVTAPPERVPELVDTEGAGDAFTAVLLVGILRRWPLEVMLRRATAFAAAICRVDSALPADEDIYQRFLRVWRP
jgi:fructokinase